MTDQTTASATDAPEPTTSTTETPEELGDAGKKALDSERKARREAEARIKELEPLAAQLQQIEDAKKDDATRAAEALSAAEKARDEALAQAARLQAAVEHGLTSDDLALLGDGTPDEISERAAALAARLNAAGGPSKPTPNPAQGRAEIPPALNSSALEDSLRRAVGAS